MKAYNQTRQTMLIENGRLANTAWSRGLGLMGRAGLPPGDGLVLDPGGPIHTCFMRFPLDVVFVGRDSRAVLLLERLRPWRFSPLVRGARYVLEAPPGVIASSRTAVGDVIVLER